MARKSTLGRRVGYVLDRTQFRGEGRAAWGFAVVCFAILVSGGIGLTGLHAQEKASSAAAPQSTWSRTYRDTYRLQKSFADHFPGTSEIALAAFRSELSLAKVSVPETLEIELRPDKDTLVLQYDQTYEPSKHQSLIDYLVRAGWWEKADSLKARIQATEQELAPLLKMLEDARVRTQDAAVQMAKIRDRDRIIDPDPDTSNAVISTADRNIVAIETQLSEQRLKVTRIEGSFEMLQKLKPQEIGQGLRVLMIEDVSIDKMLEKQQDAAVEEAIVAAEKGPDHPEIKVLRARKEAIEDLLVKALGRVVSNQATLLAIEKRTLATLEGRFKEAQSSQIEDKKRTQEYLEAKTRYLQARRVSENIELKYNNEIIERNAGH